MHPAKHPLRQNLIGHIRRVAALACILNALLAE